MSWLDRINEEYDRILSSWKKEQEAKGIGPVADGDKYSSDVERSQSRKNMGPVADPREMEHLQEVFEGRQGMGPVVNPLEYGGMLDVQAKNRKGAGTKGVGPFADGDAYSQRLEEERPKPAPATPSKKPSKTSPKPADFALSAPAKEEAKEAAPAPEAPIDNEALNELAKTNPGLVDAYRKRMGLVDAEGKPVEKKGISRRELALLAQTAGEIFEDFSNSQKQDVILKNRMGELGKAPVIRQQERDKYDQSALDKFVDISEKNELREKEDKEKHFWNELKLREVDKKDALEASFKDPNSAESQSARQYMKYLIPSIEKDVPGFATASAAQLEKASPTIMAKWKSDIEATRNKETMDWQKKKHGDEMSFRRQELDQKNELAKSAAEEKRRKLQHKMAIDIRKEVSKDKIFQDADAIDMSIAKVNELLKSPPSGVRDEALLVMFQKALDPGSVVREGEFARTVEGSSVLNRMMTLKDKLTTGKRLTPEMRAEIVSSMNDMQRGVNSVKEQRLIPYENEISMYELPRDIILRGSGNSGSGSSGSASPSAPSTQRKPAPHGERVKQGNKTYKWNGSEYIEE